MTAPARMRCSATRCSLLLEGRENAGPLCWLKLPAASRRPSIQQRPATRAAVPRGDALRSAERLPQDVGVRPCSERDDDAHSLWRLEQAATAPAFCEAGYLVDAIDEEKHRTAHSGLGKNAAKAADGHAVGPRRRGRLSNLDQQLAKQSCINAGDRGLHPPRQSARRSGLPAAQLDPQPGHERGLSGAGTPLHEDRRIAPRFDGVVQPLRTRSSARRRRQLVFWAAANCTSEALSRLRRTAYPSIDPRIWDDNQSCTICVKDAS